MRHLLLLLLLLAGLPAAEIPAATPLRWEAGKIALSAAVGRLTASGNKVWLAEGVDDAVEAELPAVDGTWWDGVAAICRAFALRPDEGEASDEQVDLPGMPVPVGHGTLVLAPGQAPSMQSIGSLLAALDSDGDLRLWLRAEPRIERGSLAWARSEAPGSEGGRTTTFEPAESPQHLPPAAVWRPSSPVAPGTSLSLAVHTAGIGRWNGRATLAKPGETVRFTADGKEFAAALLVDAAPAEWEGHGLPDRRPLVAVTGPSSMMTKAFFRLRQGEGELGARGSGSRTDNDKMVQYRFLRAAPEGAIELEIEGRQVTAPAQHQLRLAVPPVPAAAGGPLERPTPIAWEASERPLALWLSALATGGNPVLPEVGVDTAQKFAVPAVRGGFWDGLLAVGAAAGLAPGLPPGKTLSSGAVRLVRRPPSLATAACGPLLIDAQVLPSNRGELSLGLRLALEPRLNEDSYAAPDLRWASWAIDEQGRVHELVASAAQGQGQGQGRHVFIQGINIQNIQGGNIVIDETMSSATPAGPLPQVTVRLSAPGAKRLELNGLVTLPRLRVWRGSAELVADKPSELLLGPRAVELTALTTQTRLGNLQVGPGLLLRGVHGAASVQFSLTGEDGQSLEGSREANRMGGGQMTMRPWLGWCRVPPQGKMTAEVAVRAAQSPLILPLRLVVPVPDGL